jgi:hypothetical protein
MNRFHITIDGESTVFTTIDSDWTKLPEFLMEEPFHYSHTTNTEKQIADIIIEKLYLEYDSDSIICISPLEDPPNIRIEIKE